MRTEAASTLRLRGRWLVVVLLTAALPFAAGPPRAGFDSAGQALGVGLISDDAAALGYVHRAGALADWLGTEYDLVTVRFWRPLVTASLGLQERLTGVAPEPLRGFNWAGHALSAVLAAVLARRLGAREAAAVAAGVLTALYPHVGGNVVWAVGRVDAQCVPFVLGALVLLVDGRSGWAAAAAFGALATKELGVVTPALGALVLLARGARGDVLRRLAPMLAVTALVVLWRRLALGVWVGGYPAVEPSGAGGPGALASGALASASALARALPVTLGVWAAAVLVGFVAARRRPEDEAGRVVWLALAAPLAAAPLVHLLAGGEVAREHLRTLFLADTAALVAAAALLGRRGVLPRGAAVTALAVAAVVAGLRGAGAALDVARWSAAGRVAGEVEARARAALVDEPPSERPVLLPEVPRALDGAYVLHWGVADRFRAPFPPTPRPVWPWRPLFELPGVERRPVIVERDGLLRPFASGPPRVPGLRLRATDEAGGALERLVVDARVVASDGPRLLVEGVPAGARLEALFATELGYGVGRLAATPEAGGAAEVRLRELFLATSAPEGGVALWQALAQAADVGARVGYLELRAIAPEGPGAAPLAASGWLEVAWTADVRDALLR